MMNAIPSLPSDLLPALGLADFVAVSLETTGSDPAFERILELGAVSFSQGREVSHFSSTIRYRESLKSGKGAVSETKSDRSGTPRRVLTDLLTFIGGQPVICHDLDYTLGFLDPALKRLGHERLSEDHLLTDTGILACVLLPTLPSPSLSVLAQYFNVDPSLGKGERGDSDKSRTLSNACVTSEVFLHLLAYLKRVDIKSVDVLRRIADGFKHPSAWIFPAWFNYLMLSPTLESDVHPYRIPYLLDNSIGKLPKMSRFTTDDCREDSELEPVDSATVKAFFTAAGDLAQTFPHFEVRSEQEEMATACTEVICQGGILAVEAGTGVGKSLAYLVPAIYWAQANRDRSERVVISTNTINLQEQLFYKDLPQLVDSLPEPFSAVLLKGRNNYLCLSRWETLITEHPLRLNANERMALLPLVLWAAQTRSGDISEVGAFSGEGSFGLWGQLGSEGGSCRGARCGSRNRCFHARARAAAAKVDVVVVNHALLMADLAANHQPIGAYNTLVVDEAHHLERAASQHLGRELNYFQFRFWVGRMYESEGMPNGHLARILQHVSRVQSDHPVLPSLKSALQEAGYHVNMLRQAAQEFFRVLTAALRDKIPRQDNNYIPKLRLRKPADFLQEGPLADAPLLQSILAVEKALRQIISALDDISATILPQAPQWKDEVSGAMEELLQFKATFVFFFSPVDDSWVFWAELPRRQEYFAQLFAAPLNAGDVLRERLFNGLRACILTSATLTVAGRFHYFFRKVGLSDTPHTRTLKLGSPFDLKHQMFVVLPAFLPSPRSPDFEAHIGALTREIVRRVPRGTLGLFTSYRALQAVSEALREIMPGRALLLQGQNGSRDQLLRRFREEPGSVLLGTDSFWEGIDVVGEALELLLVAKLPFEVPSEPLVEARLEKLKNEGKDPFMYYTVPEAVIRLRQGVGRLIRSKTDRGAAIICDSRLDQSRYGKAFLESLPVPIQVFHTPEELVEALERFFEEEKNAS
jgi:predicted DnaQ family exonuclease/DinG family helicase